MSETVIKLNRKESFGRKNLHPKLKAIAEKFEEPVSVFDFEIDWENEVLGPDENLRLVGKSRLAVEKMMEVFSVESFPRTLIEVGALKNSALIMRSRLRLIRRWGFSNEKLPEDLVNSIFTEEELLKLLDANSSSLCDGKLKSKLHELYLRVLQKI